MIHDIFYDFLIKSMTLITKWEFVNESIFLSFLRTILLLHSFYHSFKFTFIVT